jgi:hypothetical protein
MGKSRLQKGFHSGWCGGPSVFSPPKEVRELSQGAPSDLIVDTPGASEFALTSFYPSGDIDQRRSFKIPNKERRGRMITGRIPLSLATGTQVQVWEME